MMAIIRRARLEDARGIHEAHMRSIQQICSKDHSPEEIRAWGGRPFQEVMRRYAISNHHVWVIEENEAICGYGHQTTRGEPRHSFFEPYSPWFLQKAWIYRHRTSKHSQNCRR